LPLYLAPDRVKLRLAVMQSEILVEAAQHHHSGWSKGAGLRESGVGWNAIG